MTGAQIITQTMEQFPENELIFASKLYADQLCKAVSEGKREFSAIAVVGGERDAGELPFCPPCGVCRQFMREFCGEEFRIFLGKGGEASGFAVKEYWLKELLPCSFGGELFKEMRKDK